MRVLSFEALIESECLEASNTHQVGVIHLFSGEAVAIKEFGLNYRHLVQIKNNGGVRDVERRDCPASG